MLENRGLNLGVRGSLLHVLLKAGLFVDLVGLACNFVPFRLIGAFGVMSETLGCLGRSVD